VLSQIEGEADRHEIDAKLGATSTDQTRGRTTGLQDTPLALQAELLRRMAGEIRAAKDGPFRPLSQEPVVRGILLVLGGTGGITTAEFLFLSR
jgi:hypothetical protein